MIRVTIVDDHPLIREGLKKVIGKEIDLQLVDELADGGELLAALESNEPDILILDMTLPGKSGLELLKEIRNPYPSLPVLILSIHPAERYAIRSLRAGANGYLCKTSISENLVKAIRVIVTQNKRFITDEVANQLARQVNSKGRPLHETLSDREFEVLCSIAKGKDVHEIADELSLSPHTVHTYRSRIKEKMNLASNVEMTRYAIENELIN